MSKKNNNSASPAPDTAVGVAASPPVPQQRGYVYKHQPYPNPLSDPAIATTLLETNQNLATPAEFTKERHYSIYVPSQFATAFANAPTGNKPAARIALFFGVGPEILLFRLREFFASEVASVLITIPGVESGWTGITSAFGYGITTQIIQKLLSDAGLGAVGEIGFSVEVMAGYSTGYRGVNQTIINQLVDLSNLTRLIYLDAWYHHDDHPLAPSSSPYFKKNTLWAVDTALGKSSSAKLVIYGFTGGHTASGGGVPRTNPNQANRNAPNPPKEPIAPLITKYPSRVSFVDFEYSFNNKPPIDDQLERICLARLVQLGTGGPYQQAAVPAALSSLISALPDRGSFGTLGLSGFTDLYGWVSANNGAISGFDETAAMGMITQFQLLQTWTTPSLYEMRHRMFVLELGKEPLLP